jgi:hypothetical protein
MLGAVEKPYKTYNEGRLAFRPYFATCGPNVKQNNPRMPPNPHVGYYEDSRGSTGSSLSCAATSCLTQACAGFTFVEFLIAAFEGLLQKSWVLQPLVMTERQNDRR